MDFFRKFPKNRRISGKLRKPRAEKYTKNAPSVFFKKRKNVVGIFVDLKEKTVGGRYPKNVLLSMLRRNISAH